MIKEQHSSNGLRRLGQEYTEYYVGGVRSQPEEFPVSRTSEDKISKVAKIAGPGVVLMNVAPPPVNYIGLGMVAAGMLYPAAEPVITAVSEKIKNLKK